MHLMVSHQEVLCGEQSNDRELNSRALALSEGSICCKRLRRTFSNSVVQYIDS